MAELNYSLERRLVSYVGLGLLLFALIAGVVSFGVAYRSQLDTERTFQRQLVRTVQSQAEVAIFAHNATIAQELFAGLLSNPTVLGVRLISTEGPSQEQGKRAGLDFSGAARFVLYSPVDGRHSIGAIFLLPDDSEIGRIAARRAFDLTVALLVQIVIGAALIFGVSRAVMGKPIAELAAAVGAIRPGRKVRVPIKPEHAKDEIGLLSRRINTLVETAEAAMAESEQAKEAAEFANRAKSEFLALMSHEIRTPLSAVIGILELALRDEALQVRTRAQIEHGNINAKSLLKIINDLLDFSKIEGGKLSLETIDFALVHCIEEAVDVFRHSAADGKVHLHVAVAPEVPEFARGDPTRLRQILINLVGNAMKFTESGEVRIDVTLAERRAGGSVIAFAVRDSGPGIAPEAIPRLFNKFEQSDTSTARRFGGTGLGLAICRQLVELMGGTIGVDSAIGVGTTFAFQLPFADGDAIAPDLAHPTQRHAHRLRILVAEDFITNQIIIRSMLEDMGHQVDVVENGRLAVEAVARLSYDLLLMDGRMPEMDGISATRLIRAGGPPDHRAREPGLPIVALTANVGEEDRRRYLASGMDEVMIKPIDEATLHRQVERVIAARLAGGVALEAQPARATVQDSASETMADRRDASVPDRRDAARAVPTLAELDSMFAPVAPEIGAPAPTSAGASGSPPEPPVAPRAARSGVSPAVHLRARAAFIDEVAGRKIALDDALARRDQDKAALILHSLRGGAAYLNQGELLALCTELEHAADAGRWPVIELALPRLHLLLAAC